MAISIIHIIEAMVTEIMVMRIIRIMEGITNHMVTPLIMVDMIITTPGTVETG
jgi:hypothetical protein